jgi:multidrug efflux pump subunit AcrB
MTCVAARGRDAVKRRSSSTPGVVDVDWTVEAPQQSRHLPVDRARAAAAGASVEQITQTLYLALRARRRVWRRPTAREAVAIVPRLPERSRSSRGAAERPRGHDAGAAAAGSLRDGGGWVREGARMRKDLRPAIYVTADVADEVEARSTRSSR